MYLANNIKKPNTCKKDGNYDNERKMWTKGMKIKKSKTSPRYLFSIPSQIYKRNKAI